MASVLMICGCQDSSVGQFKPTSRALQCLNSRLFIHAYDHLVLRRVQIKPHNIGSVACELGIRRDTAAPPSLKDDAMLAQHGPDLIGRYAGPLLQKPSVLPGVSFWERLIDLAKNRTLGFCPILGRLSATAFIQQAFQALLRNPAAPLANPCCSSPKSSRNLSVLLCPFAVQRIICALSAISLDMVWIRTIRPSSRCSSGLNVISLAFQLIVRESFHGTLIMSSKY
jgi:hypothetical protein